MTSITHTISEIQKLTRQAISDGRPVVLIPTMGALHEGHLSLVDTAYSLELDNPFVVMSIFVNPLQFAAGEDLDSYPRTLDADAAKLAAHNHQVHAIFAPSPAEMYPLGPRTTITPGAAALRFEGATRPTHFAGVLTVVNKLFQITQCQHAIFGEKDFQKLALIRQMVADFNFPVHVHGSPLMRDHDGVALSSRNVYLSEAERVEARRISAALRQAAMFHVKHDIIAAATNAMAGMDIDYIDVVAPDFSEPTAGNELYGDARIITAVKVGSTRLLDNMAVNVEKPNA